MKVLILGIDGYIGWALANKLLDEGYQVSGIDDSSRRNRVREIGGNSAYPIQSIPERRVALRQNKLFGDWINVSLGNDSSGFIRSVLDTLQPDCIVHLAEQPSAPWSMRDVEYASATQKENVLGTLHLLWAIKESCPEAHLVKLGTMGEYGTPDCDIPEGMIPPSPCKYTQGNGALSELGECPMWGLPFPRSPNSFYHLSKVHDTHNIIFACKTWGLRSTDIMQGIVFGHDYGTRLDYDQYFGTVINRFCAQAAIGCNLTVYGSGLQTRGFLTLNDSLQCLKIAIDNPPDIGEYRTFNQFEHTYRIVNLAEKVIDSADELGMDRLYTNVHNPRFEDENHYYLPAHQKLLDLGYNPTTNIDEEITRLLVVFMNNWENINKEVIMPTTTWR